MFEDKVVLVTGSSRGIGAAIAREFGRSGARVAVHGRDRSAAQETEAMIHHDGGHAMSVIADVRDFDAIEEMRHTIEDRFGPVDILIPNAGGSLTKRWSSDRLSTYGAVHDGTRAAPDASPRHRASRLPAPASLASLIAV